MMIFSITLGRYCIDHKGGCANQKMSSLQGDYKVVDGAIVIRHLIC